MGEAQWHKDAVIYQLHVKAFFDSNGDGVGDFQGLLQKLDHIETLGANCIWLLPFFPSPLRDDGYDIADYCNVHPAFGTLEDFQAFLEEAHHRRIRVIVELVLNHTSDQHPWFQEARREPSSAFRDYYVWSDTDERYRQARIIFRDTERSNWTWDPVAKAYFWHRFFSHQPDLNVDNPVAQDEIHKVIGFWLDRGVDGLRCDAVPYLFEREGTSCENLLPYRTVVSGRPASDASDRQKRSESSLSPEGGPIRAFVVPTLRAVGSSAVLPRRARVQGAQHRAHPGPLCAAAAAPSTQEGTARGDLRAGPQRASQAVPRTHAVVHSAVQSVAVIA